MKIPEATMKRRKNENTPYGNAEKERVIEGSETETAHQLGLLPEGQKTRENHNASDIMFLRLMLLKMILIIP